MVLRGVDSGCYEQVTFVSFSQQLVAIGPLPTNPGVRYLIESSKIGRSRIIGERQVFNRSVVHSVRQDDESMKPPSNVRTPAQYIASLSADRAKTIATVRALVNKHIPRGYYECLVWGTIGWTIPLSRYPDTYNKQPICYVAPRRRRTTARST